MALFYYTKCSSGTLSTWRALQAFATKNAISGQKLQVTGLLATRLQRPLQGNYSATWLPQQSVSFGLAGKAPKAGVIAGSRNWSMIASYESSKSFSPEISLHSSKKLQRPFSYASVQLSKSSPLLDPHGRNCSESASGTLKPSLSSRHTLFKTAASHETLRALSGTLRASPSQHTAAVYKSAAPVSVADWQLEMDSQEPMKSTLAYLGEFTNHERKGVPKGAGTDTEEGFPLRRMEWLMQGLGDPVSKLKVVHVAGTKGKGSVVALLAASLRRAKLKVGAYTSPHFLTVRERISINGSPISPDAFAALVATNRPVLDRLYQSEGVTHFEVLTALAFKHFAEEGVDVAIMEAGLGGARDATNVIPSESLLLAVITAVHVEHLEALGGSLEAIVRAKCGIIKEGRPVLLAAQKLDVVGGVEAAAQAKRAPLIKILSDDAGRVWAAVRGASLSTGPSRDVSAHQGITSETLGDPPKRGETGVLWENAAAAFRAAQIVLSQGFPTVDLPAIPLDPSDALPAGRMQCLSDNEADKLGVRNKRVVLDGAHTPDSFRELCRALSDSSSNGMPVKVLFVIAMSTDKDHRACLTQLAASGLDLQTPIFTEVPVAGSFERATPAEALAQCWGDVREEPAACERNFGAALGRAAAAPDDVMVCVTGSMHTVGAALREIAGIGLELERQKNT